MGVLGEAQAYKLKSSVWKPARFSEGSEALRWILGSERANSSIDAKIWVKNTDEGQHEQTDTSSTHHQPGRPRHRSLTGKPGLGRSPDSRLMSSGRVTGDQSWTRLSVFQAAKRQRRRQRQCGVSHLREERSLLSLLLQTVSHQSLHGLGAVAADLTEVWRQVPSAHHENDLHHTVHKHNFTHSCQNIRLGPFPCPVSLLYVFVLYPCPASLT